MIIVTCCFRSNKTCKLITLDITGSDIQELLIPAEDLLSCEELGELKEESTFKFLVNAGYEKINQLVGS